MHQYVDWIFRVIFYFELKRIIISVLIKIIILIIIVKQLDQLLIIIIIRTIIIIILQHASLLYQYSRSVLADNFICTKNYMFFGSYFDILRVQIMGTRSFMNFYIFWYILHGYTVYYRILTCIDVY